MSELSPSLLSTSPASSTHHPFPPYRTISSSSVGSHQANGVFPLNLDLTCYFFSLSLLVDSLLTNVPALVNRRQSQSESLGPSALYTIN